MQDSKKLQKKAKCKWLQKPKIDCLILLNSPLKPKYYTTLHCSSSIKTHEGKTSSRYCKRPWCIICNRIRMAVRLNAYAPELAKLEGLQMTTLTAPNCDKDGIVTTIKLFRKVFRQFRDTYKKRTGKDFKGVYNIECTIVFNDETKRYHPHVHIIHEALDYWYEKGKEWKAQVNGGTSTGCNIKWTNILIEYWLKKCPQATRAAQDTRICTSLLEGFKYTNKSIYKQNKNGQSKTVIPLLELDQLYNAIVGVRCFQPFGIKKTIVDEDKEFERLESYNVEAKPDGVYKWKKHDWYHNVTDTPLSDYHPNEKEILYYDKLSSITTKKTNKNPVHQLKRIWAIPEPSEQAEYTSALQYLLNNRGKKSSITQTDKY